MEPIDRAYAAQLFEAAQQALSDVVKSHHAKDGWRVGGPVNWADLRVVTVEHITEFAGPGTDEVVMWRVNIEEASSPDLEGKVSQRLHELGHPLIIVQTEW